MKTANVTHGILSSKPLSYEIKYFVLVFIIQTCGYTKFIKIKNSAATHFQPDLLTWHGIPII